MTIVVNGEDREVAEGATVGDLVTEMKLPAARGIAVARNGEVVLRSQWHDVALTAGDHIEVLHAVQGG